MKKKSLVEQFFLNENNLGLQSFYSSLTEGFDAEEVYDTTVEPIGFGKNSLKDLSKLFSKVDRELPGGNWEVEIDGYIEKFELPSDVIFFIVDETQTYDDKQFVLSLIKMLKEASETGKQLITSPNGESISIELK